MGGSWYRHLGWGLLSAAVLTAVFLHLSDQPERGPLVLLVSLDTTRADALGCYQEQSAWGEDIPASERPHPNTPVADIIARQGVRFAWALAHAPTTLNSHASVFTGLDPHAHTVSRNGVPLPKEIPVLAERFEAAGWDTVAVVGSSALEARMALDRGFRVYDDAVSTEVRKRFEDRADRVNQRVLAWMDDRPDASQGLFLFVHYYDAHSPWQTAPEGFQRGFTDETYEGEVDGSARSIGELYKQARAGRLEVSDRRQARGLYLAEVAWVDLQLGSLLSALSGRGYMDDALVVLFADHGETLEEQPQAAYGHGLDVDLGSIHVPLLIRGTGRFDVPEATVLSSVARLSDLGSTVLSLSGLKGQLGAGQDLSLRWATGADVDVPAHFAEATKPHVDDGSSAWPNARLERGVVHQGAMALHNPLLGEDPTLYRVAAGQPLLEDPERLEGLVVQLQAWDQAMPGGRTVTMHPETEEALEALGYLEGSDSPP